MFEGIESTALRPAGRKGGDTAKEAPCHSRLAKQRMHQQACEHSLSLCERVWVRVSPSLVWETRRGTSTGPKATGRVLMPKARGSPRPTRSLPKRYPSRPSRAGGNPRACGQMDPRFRGDDESAETTVWRLPVIAQHSLVLIGRGPLSLPCQPENEHSARFIRPPDACVTGFPPVSTSRPHGCN
jgi:hypothetical protein